MDLTKITFRHAKHTNEDFFELRSIHKEAMFDSVVETIGEWNDEFQKSRLEKHFKEAYSTLLFIEYEGKTIGTINQRLKVYEDGEFQFIEQFYLKKSYQGKGIGSYIFELKLNKDEETRLSVLKKDVKTHQFYFKNGFIEYKEDEYQKYMKKPSLSKKPKIK